MTCAVQNQRPPWSGRPTARFPAKAFCQVLSSDESQWRVRKSHGSGAAIEADMAVAQVTARRRRPPRSPRELVDTSQGISTGGSIGSTERGEPQRAAVDISYRVGRAELLCSGD